MTTCAGVGSESARPKRAVEALRNWAWLTPWATLLVAPLLLRGPLPPDELRYLSVAWEMWSSGHWIVPQLNGMPYSDKPPLLFWLMQAGWGVFGVNDWWPRLLPATFALTAILLTRQLCRRLWSGDGLALALVPWLLLGTLGWTVYTQVVLFDLLLANWTLLGLLGLIRAERGDRRGWYLVATATTLGLLTKGPAMLLHLAGPALLVAWWGRSERLGLSGWYGRLVLSILLGCLGALAWAVPAAYLGGESYASQLLLGQTTGRLLTSFAHARPFWYYLWILPIMLLPWSAWPTAWGAIRDALRDRWHDDGSRLMLAGVAPAFVGFTLISGKQPHYLLPLVPLLTALVATALSARAAAAPAATGRVPAALVAGIAVASAGLPLLPTGRELSVAAWSPAWGIGAAVLIVILGRSGSLPGVVRRLALSVPILAIAVETAFFRVNLPAYDLTGAGAFAHELERAGHPLAYVGDYNGELHYPGRLTRPFDILDGRNDDVAEWAAGHPDGYIITTGQKPQGQEEYAQPLRGGWLTIRQAAGQPAQ